MASTHYDVAVIGAGPGGYVAAIRAAQLGAKVAIVEKQYLGGTCLNVGCIPSKAMHHIGDVMHRLSSLDELGIQLPQSPTLNMSKAVVFTDKVVKRMTNGVGVLMKGNKNELTADEIIETIHPHPTLSEGLREALLAAEGRPIHIPPRQKARAR